MIVALFGAQQRTVGGQRRARGQHHAFGVDPGLAQRARRHVAFGVGKAVLQHLRDLIVGQAVAGLDDDRGLDAASRSHAPTR